MTKKQEALFKNIYLEQRVMATFIVEIWGVVHAKSYKKAAERYGDIFNELREKVDKDFGPTKGTKRKIKP